MQVDVTRLSASRAHTAEVFVSNRMLEGTVEQVSEVWLLETSEFTVLGLICFISTVLDGVTCNKASDSSMRSKSTS